MGPRSSGNDDERVIDQEGPERSCEGGPAAAARPDADDLGSLYGELASSFRRGWKREGHRSIHVGYYDESDRTPREAAMRTIRTLVDAVGVDESDRVLAVGCGAGEDSVRLARERGATVVGVDVSDTLLEVARENARENDVTDLTAFRHDDFYELSTVEDDSVDVVWGLEALCHAADIGRVLAQADRVLCDDGRVAVADFFARTDDLTSDDRRRLETIDEALPTRFGPIDEFVDALADRGFRNVDVHDGTDGVSPCMKRRYRLSRIGYPIGRLLRPFGVVSDTHVAYCRATLAMFELFERGTLGYYFVTARR